MSARASSGSSAIAVGAKNSPDFATGYHHKALLLPGAGIIDQNLQSFDTTVIRNRPHLRCRIKTVANDDGLRLFDKSLGKSLVELLVHEKPRRRGADLAGIAIFARGRQDACLDGIDVVANDNRRMTAQFHQSGLHVTGSQFGQVLANRRRAGEGNHADLRLWNEMFRNL